MTCCRVSIRVPLCPNYAKDHLYRPRAEPRGSMRHFCFSPFKIDHRTVRRFASFIFPLYIYKDVKIPGYSHRSILVADFSADLRASVLAMLILEDRPAPGLNDRLPVAKLTIPGGASGKAWGASPG